MNQPNCEECGRTLAAHRSIEAEAIICRKPKCPCGPVHRPASDSTEAATKPDAPHKFLSGAINSDECFYCGETGDVYLHVADSTEGQEVKHLQGGGTWDVPSTPEIDAVIDKWLDVTKPGSEWLVTIAGRWKLCGETDMRECHFDVAHDKDEMLVAQMHRTWKNTLRAFSRDLLAAQPTRTALEELVEEVESVRGDLILLLDSAPFGDDVPLSVRSGATSMLRHFAKRLREAVALSKAQEVIGKES